MPQFDVRRYIGRHRDDIPYVVLVQSFLYDSYRRRVVFPLVRKSVLGKVSNPRFNPAFKIENIHVVLHPREIVSAPNEQLGEFVESLSQESSHRWTHWMNC